jgi:hypothetical protein
LLPGKKVYQEYNPFQAMELFLPASHSLYQVEPASTKTFIGIEKRTFLKKYRL